MTENIESTPAEIRRIDFTGTVWFAAAALSAAVVIAAALVAGWAPAQLAPFAAAAWWTGAGAVLLAISAFGWAGCPVLGFPLPKADRQKSFCIRAGVVLYVVGGVVTSLVMLLA